MLERPIATESESAIGRLITAGDPPRVLANAFGAHPSTISRRWHRFQTKEYPGMSVRVTHAFEDKIFNEGAREHFAD